MQIQYMLYMENTFNYLSNMQNMHDFVMQVIEHRIRFELEDKAKVVVSVWGTESLPH